MKLSSLLNVNETKYETSWYGFLNNRWYAGIITKVDGKLFSTVYDGPFATKAKAEEALEKQKNASWRVFQVKDKEIIKYKRKGYDF